MRHKSAAAQRGDATLQQQAVLEAAASQRHGMKSKAFGRFSCRGHQALSESPMQPDRALTGRHAASTISQQGFK